jgi:hypothetical protein
VSVEKRNVGEMYERRRGWKREKKQTVDGVLLYGRSGHECLFAIGE